jgi:hypothetical protein
MMFAVQFGNYMQLNVEDIFRKTLYMGLCLQFR